VGLIPFVKLLLFAQVFPLVYICMTGKAQGGNSVIVSLDAHSLAITLLVRMRGNHRAVLRTADLTG
jgi:hypothetical protein